MVTGVVTEDVAGCCNIGRDMEVVGADMEVVDGCTDVSGTDDIAADMEVVDGGTDVSGTDEIAGCGLVDGAGSVHS